VATKKASGPSGAVDQGGRANFQAPIQHYFRPMSSADEADVGVVWLQNNKGCYFTGLGGAHFARVASPGLFPSGSCWICPLCVIESYANRQNRLGWGTRDW